jgi:hypothetical protein
MTTLSQSLRNLIQRVSDPWTDEQPAWLGDENGIVVTSIAGMYNARLLSGKVIQVYNQARVPPDYDIPVRIGRRRDIPTIWQIIDARQPYPVPVGGGRIEYHHEQHEFMQPDMVMLDRRQINSFSILVSDAANFVVTVFGGIFPATDGSMVKVDHQTVDLSSYVGGASAYYVSIETDETGTLSLHAGTDFGAPEASNESYVPVPDPGKYMIGYVLLYDGQEELLNEHVSVPMVLATNPSDFATHDHVHPLSEIEERDYLTELLTLEGFAGARTNPGHLRWNAITSVTLSGTTYQAFAYWNADGFMVIGKRVLDGAWTWYTTTIQITGIDNHDKISIGLDPNGYLHICYDMAADPLNYRKSDAPINTWTGTLSGLLSMTGSHETSVTYPTFINDPAGVLYFLFRDGTSANGDLYFYTYAHASTTWAAATGTGSGGLLVQGKTLSPTRNAYWYHPVFDADFGSGGFFHLAWHWRVSGDTDGANRDPAYVRWNGTSFTKSDGSSQTVPITPANQETIDATGVNLGLTGGNAVASDADGNPHVVYQKGVGAARHLYHAYHNGSTWTITQLTTSDSPILGDNDAPTYLEPAIAIDRATDTVYVFYLDDHDVPGILVAVSEPGDFSTWTRRVIYPYHPGWYGPQLDFVEWERSTVVYMPIEFWQGGASQSLYDSFPIRLLRWDPAVDQFYTFAAGDMLKAVYDTDGDGVVDNAEQLDGHPASDFALEAPFDGTTYGRNNGTWVLVTSSQLVMETGVTFPPVPLTNAEGDDWIYSS